ncbi:ATP-grasp domain-containing protein [Demequina zhanjiangensis]|uniref:ATP-grasp domain-containing protein n=1 Tax=Demequina zhanjiangensis TaxID=3051659 RepID=A0ABT8FZI3_9MICO|nr:hypothetical protein [Demequina sp. SYSU T00b26]MDN4472298.1 hypothetical protein [Demequina sp. SYSU T00b26]
MTRIALATTRDLTEIDADDQLLLDALPESELKAWEDDVDWAAYDLVVIRSTWNYIDRLDRFLAWAERVSTVTRLVNPVPVIRWNTDKRYLGQLADAGVPVVPSVFVAPGESVDDASLTGRVVVKPTIANGSNGAKLIDADPQAARDHLGALHAQGRTALIQPYLDQVDTLGEKSLIFLSGTYSHAASKAAILSQSMSFSSGLYADEEMSPATATEAEQEVARAALAAAARVLPEAADLAYARVDLLPSEEGPMLLELELTEPSLFMPFADGAAARVATSLRALLG